MSVRALLAPVTVAAAALFAAVPAAATTSAPPPADAPQTADRVKAALRDVVDLQLLQPTCGERGALTAAAVDALRTIGVEAKLTGLPTLDLGPLGWIGFGTQHPGQAVAVELHLLPDSKAPVTLTLGAKPCPVPSASATPSSPAPAGTASASVAAPSTAPSAKPAAATPKAAPEAELAQTGGSGAPVWPYAVGGAALVAAGVGTTVVVRRGVGGGR